MFKLHTYLQRYAQQQQIKLLRSVLKHTIQRTQLFPKDIYRGHSMQSPLPAHTVASHPNLASHQRSKTMVSARSCSILSWHQQTRTWCWYDPPQSLTSTSQKQKITVPIIPFQPCFSTSSWTFSWFIYFLFTAAQILLGLPLSSSSSHSSGIFSCISLHSADEDMQSSSTSYMKLPPLLCPSSIHLSHSHICEKHSQKPD